MITSLPSPDGNFSIMYDSESHMLEFANGLLSTKTLLRRLCPPPSCLRWSPDGRYVAIALPSGTPRLFLGVIAQEAGFLHLLTCPDLGPGLVHSMDFSPQSTSLAVGKADGEIRLLLPDGKWGWSSGVHPGAVTVLAFSPEGRYLASASLSGLLIVHDDATGGASIIEQCSLLVSELQWQSDQELHVIHQGSLVQIIEAGKAAP